MNTGKWWMHECGGMVCSNCGSYHDDYHEESWPDTCPACESTMSIDEYMIMHKELRLSRIDSAYYIDENEYPEWLKIMRRNNSK